MTSIQRLAIGAVLAALAYGCGDDGGGGKKPAPGPGQPGQPGQPGAPAAGGAKAPAGGAAPAGAAPRKAGGKKEILLKVYGKAEEKAANPKEAWALRTEFAVDDLRDDANGKDSRDPFRSFVIRQVVTNVVEPGTTQTTPICTEKNMRAPSPEAQDPRAKKSYALRDLRLGGIVLRGARSYALFVDTSGYGHVVRKDDCVGKEKARVTAIGAGYVTLEVTPEQGPSTVGAGPTQRKIELHPEELQIDEEQELEGGDIAPTPATEPQPEGVKEGTTDAPKQP
jgi:Tfp pilus assembly protein PilP